MPLPSGSMGRSRTFQSLNRRNSRCLLLMSWSTRATNWFWSPPVLATVLKLFMVPDGVTTPGAFGAGQRLSNAFEVELIRSGEMRLLAHGVGLALLAGHAPWASTTPAQGSTIFVLMEE